MIAHIIIGSRAVGLSAGAALRHTRDGRPSKRPEDRAHREYQNTGCGPLRTVFGLHVVACVRGGTGVWDWETARIVSPRLNLRRPFQASGRLRPFGNARVKFRQEPSRCVANPFHLSRSFVASAFHKQRSTGAIPNVREVVGEVRNVVS